MSKEKVLIPNRGVIAMDIINSMNAIGLETIILHSPEDALGLPVKLADRSFKFYASRPEHSYLDMDAVLEKALELRVDYIHPGYGFLSENPDFAARCLEEGIGFIGPSPDVLRLVQDKAALNQAVTAMGFQALKQSPIIRSPLDFEAIAEELKYPVIIKPNRAYGGRGIRIGEYKKDSLEKIQFMLGREIYREQGLVIEDYFPFGHQIEIPFLRDSQGKILILPEIEASIQRRFQKILQESPSPNISPEIRESLIGHSTQILDQINYIGLGNIEFIVNENEIYFSEINPTFQINTLIPEVHTLSNFIKKQFAISRGEPLFQEQNLRIITPQYHVFLVSLMAEDPYNNFQPSAGEVSDFFYYSDIRTIFKTILFTGAPVSPMYDPYIGKILSFSPRREESLRELRRFLDNIIIRGIRTNLIMLKQLLRDEELNEGSSYIDFINLKLEFPRKNKSDEELTVAAALLAADFHIDNRRKNYKTQLEQLKQPGLIKRLFGLLRGDV